MRIKNATTGLLESYHYKLQFWLTLHIIFAAHTCTYTHRCTIHSTLFSLVSVHDSSIRHHTLLPRTDSVHSVQHACAPFVTVIICFPMCKGCWQLTPIHMRKAHWTHPWMQPTSIQASTITSLHTFICKLFCIKCKKHKWVKRTKATTKGGGNKKMEKYIQ